jgi:hypothetical protein
VSRKLSIRFPDDLYEVLDRQAGEASLSKMIVTALREIVQGRRPLLQPETARRLWAHCRTENKDPDNVMKDVLHERLKAEDAGRAVSHGSKGQ